MEFLFFSSSLYIISAAFVFSVLHQLWNFVFHKCHFIFEIKVYILRNFHFCTWKIHFHSTRALQKFRFSHKDSTDIKGFDDHWFRRSVFCATGFCLKYQIDFLIIKKAHFLYYVLLFQLGSRSVRPSRKTVLYITVLLNKSVRDQVPIYFHSCCDKALTGGTFSKNT